MKRYVSTWAPVCALIGLSLALISCAKGTSTQDGLPSPTSAMSSITTGYEPVVMVILPGGSGICTGTFVHPRLVVTAAHCTKNAGTYRVKGYIGGATVEASTGTRRNFGPGLVNDPNDLSALYFESDVISASAVYPIDDANHTGDVLRLVGYGCNDLSKKTGAGVKRTGTNLIYDLNDYVEFLTPRTASAGVISSNRGILGASNRAGSCFGDSGGPALDESSGTPKLSAVTHAGGYYGDSILSQYVDLTRSDNRNFLAGVASEFGITVSGL